MPVAETIHTSLSFLVFSRGNLTGYAGNRRGVRERFVKVGGKLMLAGETENNLYFGFFGEDFRSILFLNVRKYELPVSLAEALGEMKETNQLFRNVGGLKRTP